MLTGFRCERVAFGAFERGPIHFLIDAHGNIEPPEACAAEPNGTTRFRVLLNLFTDDAEVGAALRDAYGVPVQEATFTVADQDLVASALHTTSWTLKDGGPTSTMTVLDYKQNDHNAPVYERLFWSRGAGIVAWEIEVETDGAVTNLAANGTVHPPRSWPATREACSPAKETGTPRSQEAARSPPTLTGNARFLSHDDPARQRPLLDHRRPSSSTT